jgi:uncharacterized protein YndB with AHSA1/START domain
MSAGSTEQGRIRHVDGGFEGRIERVYAHDPSALWRMLTEPQGLAQWLAPGTVELRAGGAVRIDFADSGTVIDSKVLALDAPRLLEYSWSSGTEPERPLRWELNPVAGGTQLVLTVRIPATEDAPKACAGFDAHLDMLAGALEGVPIKFPFQRYLDARKHYQQQLGG